MSIAICLLKTCPWSLYWQLNHFQKPGILTLWWHMIRYDTRLVAHNRTSRSIHAVYTLHYPSLGIKFRLRPDTFFDWIRLMTKGFAIHLWLLVACQSLVRAGRALRGGRDLVHRSDHSRSHWVCHWLTRERETVIRSLFIKLQMSLWTF